jgi:hypothetical protein
MKGSIRLLFFLAFAFADFLTAAQQVVQAPTKIFVRAVRLSSKISLDGRLDEPCWKDEHAFSEFTQRDPVEGAKPTESTAVDVLYDDEAIYIGARMYDSQPKLIVARLNRKDVQVTSDSFTFYVDPYLDRRTGFYFSLNAAGTKYDGTLSNDTWDSSSWDGVWEGEAHRDSKGWTAEMKIPYSQLRFQKKEKHTWGINFKRLIARKNEADYLAYQPKNGNGFVSRFAQLSGIENIKPPRRIEIIPYATSKVAYTTHDAGNPLNDGSDYDPGLGADAKIGLGSNLTLDATVNPDFGQVEVDPAVVNLGDVETFFEEKRPFFIEGSSIFDFGRGGATNYWGFNWSDPLLFYSRRIGRPPQGSLPDVQFDNAPALTKILGAAKVSGHVGNGWCLGSLHAFTGKEMANLADGGRLWRAEVEPLTYYGVNRASKEFQGGRQGIGMMTTFASRFFDENVLREDINSKSFVVGTDGWSFLDEDRSWVISGWAAYSHVAGSSKRIEELQKNSQHYFQRPDANYVEVDPFATSLSGYTARVYVVKQKGNVVVNSAFGMISPGFDTNDLGFLWRADQINSHFGGGYKWTTPGKFYRYAELGAAVFRTLDYDWNTTWAGLFHFGYVELQNYFTIDYSLAWNPERTVNNTRTRGGPRTLNLPGYEANVFVNSDSRKKWVFGFGGNLYQSDSSTFRVLQTKVEWKPISNLSVSVNPLFERDTTPAQWIDNFDDPLATSTFGARYVFGELKQKTLSSSLRLNWTFSPKLSLQLYAQPLVSSGNYRNYKELERPRSYDFRIYNQDFIRQDGVDFVIDPDGPGPANSIRFENPNFNIRSLRGNAILRWEYKPGSAVYFVWTQTRSDEEDIGAFQFGRSFGKLWRANSDNIFMVKFSYYLNL